MLQLPFTGWTSNNSLELLIDSYLLSVIVALRLHVMFGIKVQNTLSTDLNDRRYSTCMYVYLSHEIFMLLLGWPKITTKTRKGHRCAIWGDSVQHLRVLYSASNRLRSIQNL